MSETYRAIMNGNYITWLDAPPRAASIEVQVILVKEIAMPTRERGIAMADALSRLAQTNPFDTVEPVMWQREAREDKTLPYRDR